MNLIFKAKNVDLKGHLLNRYNTQIDTQSDIHSSAVKTQVIHLWGRRLDFGIVDGKCDALPCLRRPVLGLVESHVEVAPALYSLHGGEN